MREKQLLLSPASAVTSPGPTVESPVTPHNSSAPPTLSHALNNLTLEQLEHSVSIEEVTCSSPSGSGGCSPDIQEVLSAPHSPVKDLPETMLHSIQTQSLPRGSSNNYLFGPGMFHSRAGI